MAATDVKPRAPKAIAVSKLIGGKLVTALAKSEREKLEKALQLCRDLGEIEEWHTDAAAAELAIDTLIGKVKG